jgi:GNAT superfamily N-acetyltransferase
MTSPLTVREATADDLGHLIAMGRKFLAATAYGGRIQTDPEHMARLAAFVQAQGTFFIAERDAEPVGMIGVITTDHPVVNRRVGIEIVWWADASARGAGAGRRLMTAAEAWARGRGAALMQFGAYRDARLERLYQHYGYTPTEVVFEKGLSA